MSQKGKAASPNTPAAHRQKTAGQRKSEPAKVVFIVLAVILAILLGVLAACQAYRHWAKLPDLPELPAQGQVADPITGEIPENVAMNNSPRKKEFYTFLVVGRDTGGGGNTDTIMLCAYDIPNQRLSVMSIPRDTMVDANHPDRNRRINGVWNLGLYYAKKGSEKPGIEYLKEAIGQMMGFTPDFHVIVKWEAFGRLVDAIGGVEFEVPFTMQYTDPTQDLYINVPAGKRVLTGKEAMGVVRWRHNNSFSVAYADGDLGRVRTQQALMKEVVKKCLKIENVTKINEFASIFSEEVETDLTLGNLVAFAQRAIFGGLTMDNVIFTTLPNTPIYVGADSYVQANPEELLGILNDGFNPYTEDLDMQALHILQYKSSTGYYTYDGTGTGKTPVYTNPKPAQAVIRPESEPSASPPASDDPAASASPGTAPSAEPGADPSGKPGGAASDPPGIGEPDDPEPSAVASRLPGETAPPSAPPAKSPSPVSGEASAAPAPSQPSGDLGIPMD